MNWVSTPASTVRTGTTSGTRWEGPLHRRLVESRESCRDWSTLQCRCFERRTHLASSKADPSLYETDPTKEGLDTDREVEGGQRGGKGDEARRGGTKEEGKDVFIIKANADHRQWHEIGVKSEEGD